MEKVSLPINPAEKQKLSIGVKTKIAAWWMIATGIIIIVFPMILFPEEEMRFLILIFFLHGLFFLIFNFYLLKRKKWAWYAIIISLFNIVACGIVIIFLFTINLFALTNISIKEISRDVLLLIIFGFVPFLIPLVLLLLDRKNFWKIAT